ncbi:TPA: DUF3596 domain-containing protein [Salmonella enterica]|nr:DUF3596 domain-containing protein [Salmonella enterica]
MFPTEVELHNGNIRISFYYSGTRCREVLKGWVVSNSNIKKASNLRIKILSEIQFGTFDYRATFPTSKAAKKFGGNSPASSFGEQAKSWYENKKLSYPLTPLAVTTLQSIC